MTVLVTGGSGYIGSHTCLELLKEGHDVVVVDNLSNSSPKALERVEELSGGRKILFVCCDVRDRQAMEQVFDRCPAAVYTPAQNRQTRDRRYAGWQRAVHAVLSEANHSAKDKA